MDRGTSNQQPTVDEDAGRLLREAALRGDVGAGAALLEGGVDVESTSSKGGTAMYYAAQEGHAEFILLLLDSGARVNVAVGADAVTPLLSASSLGRAEAVEVLLAAGADANAVRAFDGATSLLFAVASGNVRIAEALLCAGADKDAARGDGTTPLFLACQNGDAALVGLLLAAGANRNIRRQGILPEDQARARRHFSVAALFDAPKSVPTQDGMGSAAERRLEEGKLVLRRRRTVEAVRGRCARAAGSGGVVDLKGLGVSDELVPFLSLGSAWLRRHIREMDWRCNPDLHAIPPLLATLPAEQLTTLRIDRKLMHDPVERVLLRSGRPSAVIGYLQLISPQALSSSSSLLDLRGTGLSAGLFQKLFPLGKLPWTDRIRCLDLRDNPAIVELPRCLARLNPATTEQLLIDATHLTDPVSKLLATGGKASAIIEFARMRHGGGENASQGLLDFGHCGLTEEVPLPELGPQPWIKRVRRLSFANNPDLHRIPGILRVFDPADILELRFDHIYMSSAVERALAQAGDPTAIIEHCRAQHRAEYLARVESSYRQVMFSSSALGSLLDSSPSALDRDLLATAWRTVECPECPLAMKKEAFKLINQVTERGGGDVSWWLSQPDQDGMLDTFFSLPTALLRRGKPLLAKAMAADVRRMGVMRAIFSIEASSRLRNKAESLFLSLVEDHISDRRFVGRLLKKIIGYPEWSCLSDADLSFLSRIKAAFEFHRIHGDQEGPLMDEFSQKIRALGHHLMRQNRQAESASESSEQEGAVLGQDLQVLCDPAALLENGLLLESSLDGVGKVIFALTELPVGQYFKTGSGNSLTRIDPRRCVLSHVTSSSKRIERVIPIESASSIASSSSSLSTPSQW
ncbi:MAG: ankyrin repeat domain-containing protein [archaeon]|nr:ankyrin repeat domain-containing protein [archaeon]